MPSQWTLRGVFENVFDLAWKVSELAYLNIVLKLIILIFQAVVKECLDYVEKLVIRAFHLKICKYVELY